MRIYSDGCPYFLGRENAGLRKYKAKVKKIVEGIDPCSNYSIVILLDKFKKVQICLR